MPEFHDPYNNGGLAEVFRNRIGRPALPDDVKALLHQRGITPEDLSPGELCRLVFNAGLEPLEGFSWPLPRPLPTVPFQL